MPPVTVMPQPSGSSCPVPADIFAMPARTVKYYKCRLRQLRLDFNKKTREKNQLTRQLNRLETKLQQEREKLKLKQKEANLKLFQKEAKLRLMQKEAKLKQKQKPKTKQAKLKQKQKPKTKLPAPPNKLKQSSCLTVDGQGVVWKIVSPTREGSWHHWP